jgi:hypothetical protein
MASLTHIDTELMINVELQGSCLWSERFVDHDVERDYRAFETNALVTRHIGPVLAVILCGVLVVEHYATGDAVSVTEGLVILLAALVALCVEMVVYRGAMSQRVQIIVRMTIFLVFVPLCAASAFFHDNFFSVVRLRTSSLFIPAAFAMAGITPSSLPALLDGVLRVAFFRLSERAFIGITLSLQSTISLGLAELFTGVGIVLAVRARNRSQFADFATAQQSQLAWANARQTVHNQFTRLVPPRIAARFTDPTAEFTFFGTAFFAPHALILALTCSFADGEEDLRTSSERWSVSSSTQRNPRTEQRLRLSNVPLQSEPVIDASLIIRKRPADVAGAFLFPCGCSTGPLSRHPQHFRIDSGSGIGPNHRAAIWERMALRVCRRRR